MYRFEDTTVRTHRHRPFLPTSAINYDGIFFEEAIQGYQTLSITGREMLSVNIIADSINVGSIISGQTLPPRVLTVNYLITNRDPEMILVNYRWLMEYLYREKDVSIYFNDELDLIYNGRYSMSAEVPGNSFSFESSFDIYCQDPRKYSKIFYTDGYIGGRLPFRTRFYKMIVTIARQGGLKVTDGIKTISITGTSFKPGDKVVIDFSGGEGLILVNGINKTMLLDLTSDFENFYLHNGQTITSSNGSIEIEYREVSL